MIEPLTPNTQAVLLLTAPLIAGRGEASRDLLRLSEYNRLAKILRDNKRQPADLLAPNAGDLIELCSEPFGRGRLDPLLNRGFLLSQAVEHWNSRSIWVIGRADPRYPKRLKTRLKENAPPLLYGCGDTALLDGGGLAVVGSRHVDDELVDFTENVGRIVTQAHRTIVSGGAKGVDRAAMHGALMADGYVAGVMADSLERAALARDNRESLINGRLVLVSPFDPAASFNVGHAMQRNKLIYALSDAALVVISDFERGGTWTGAIEQLDRMRFVPVFVRDSENVAKGNSALLNRGGIPWPNPRTGDELAMALDCAVENFANKGSRDLITLFSSHEPTTNAASDAATSSVGEREYVEQSLSTVSMAPDLELLKTVKDILLRKLSIGHTDEEIASLLGVTKPQAKAWLARLVTEAVLEKVTKPRPTRYRVANLREQPI